MRMQTSAAAGIFALICAVLTNSAIALPVAQLDIVGTDVTYDSSTQTVVTTDQSFTLYGYGNTATGNGKALDTSLDWYLSIAVTPQVLSANAGTTDIGSFTVDGMTYDAGDFLFGTPPLDEYASQSDTLAPHGIFDTLYMMLGVDWTNAPTRSAVDVQTTQGSDPTANPGSALMYIGWDFDVSGLADDFGLHFDLFGVTAGCSLTNIANCKVVQFAPFSHDAESVPEPETLTLLGLGLLVLGMVARRRRITHE